MQYVKAIKSSFLFFPLVALLITVPFIISNYHKYGSIHKLRTFIIYSFVLYLLTIYFLVILPLPNIDEVSKLTTPTMNLIPFSFVGDFIKDSPLVLNDPSTYIKAILDSSFYVVIFNIFMTIPLGMYLKYYYKCSFLKTSLICFLVSLFFEITQLTGLYFIYPRPYRLFDVDDLILNTSGGMIGYGIMCLIDKYLPSRDKIDMESKTLANVVSPLRRLTIAFLDLFLYFILVIIMSIFIGNHHVLIVSFIIYYLIIPVILKERTIASKFLNVKKSFKNNTILFDILMPVFVTLYYLLPYFVAILVFYLCNNLNMILLEFALLLSVIIGSLIFYTANLFCLFKNNRMLYDNIFNVEYINTIK